MCGGTPHWIWGSPRVSVGRFRTSLPGSRSRRAAYSCPSSRLKGASPRQQRPSTALDPGASGAAVRQASRQGDPAAALALHRDADILRAADPDVKHQVSSALWPRSLPQKPEESRIWTARLVQAVARTSSNFAYFVPDDPGLHGYGWAAIVKFRPSSWACVSDRGCRSARVGPQSCLVIVSNVCTRVAGLRLLRHHDRERRDGSLRRGRAMSGLRSAG